MTFIIERYIYEHINNWPVKIQPPVHLRPLIRSNKEDNGIVDRFWIGKVVFWFAGEDSCPCLVSKIMDKTVGLESVKRCAVVQEKVNEKIGYAVFPRIFDIAEISGNIVLFLEAVKGPNYEIELSRAIYGPERSLARAERVIQRQFKEMGGLIRHLQDIRTSDKPRRWGDWAYRLGQDFRNTCGFDANSLTDAHLDEMKKAIDSVPIYQHLILVEDHIANYLPGPRAVDQIDPNIEELISQRPGIIDVFRFIVAYFRAGPLAGVINDWLYAIASAIMDKDGRTIIGPPVRDILRQVGLNPEQAKVIWGFVMVTFFIRAESELEFHGKNPFVIDTLRAQFHQWTKSLVEIQELINSNKRFDLRPIILAQDNILPQAASLASPARLIEEGYKGFNIVSCENKFYGLAQDEGAFDSNKVKNNQYKKCFVSTSIFGVKELIDRFEVQNYYNLGSSYLKLKGFDKAQAAFEKTLILLENIVASNKKEAFVTTPNQSALVNCYVNSSMRLASCFLQQEDYKRAEEVFTKLVNNEFFKISPELKRKMVSLRNRCHNVSKVYQASSPQLESTAGDAKVESCPRR